MTNSNAWFAVRADASPQIGVGHIARCLALAEWAKDEGLKCIIITAYKSDFLEERAVTIDAEIAYLPESNSHSDQVYPHSHWLKGGQQLDAQNTKKHLNKKIQQLGTPPSFIIVDHYALGHPWESSLKEIAPILVIDDLNDRPHDCSWLLDQTYGKNQHSYNGLIQDSKLLIGSDYTLLRKEFTKTKRIERTSPINELKIMVSLGGVDKDNVSLTICKALLSLKINFVIKIAIVTTSLNPNIGKLEAFASSNQNVVLLKNIKNIAAVMNKYDICIGAVGSTTWERFSVGLPSVLCVTAENQKQAALILEQDNLIQLIDIRKQEVKEQLQFKISQLTQSPEQYLNNVKQISAVCDGFGAKGVLNHLLDQSEQAL